MLTYVHHFACRVCPTHDSKTTITKELPLTDFYSCSRKVCYDQLAGTCVRTMHYGVQDVYMHLLALQGPWVGEYVGVSTYPLPQAGWARRRS